MKRVTPQETWPESWKYSYRYDLQEIYGEITHRGYAYAYQTRREATLRLASEVLRQGARILDVAAAQGNFSMALAELGFDVTWNDLREDLAEYVQLKHERGRIQYVPGNVFDTEFDTIFDAVLLTEIIEHVAHPDRLLERTASLVRPGGYVIMTTPNGKYFRNRLPKFSECTDPAIYESVQFRPDADGHIFLLHPEEITPLAARAGLEVDALTLFTNPLTQGHLKTEPLLRVLPPGVVTTFEQVTRLMPRGVRERCLVQMGVRFKRPPLQAAA
ncbi:MAG TPA: methyltransferase domain-containing protein [Vicinamibacterales bacterium]|nr:methyltransferase domain-containing protein [Vicinamibacterales bacterium]